MKRNSRFFAAWRRGLAYRESSPCRGLSLDAERDATESLAATPLRMTSLLRWRTGPGEMRCNRRFFEPSLLRAASTVRNRRAPLRGERLEARDSAQNDRFTWVANGSGEMRCNGRFFAASRAPLRGERQEARDSAQNDAFTWVANGSGSRNGDHGALCGLTQLR